MICGLRCSAFCTLVCTAFLISTGLPDQEGSGMLCVAPLPTPVCSGEVCFSGDPCTGRTTLSLSVDSVKPMPWPRRESMSLTGLDLDASHRVVLLCDGKPNQSFKFRFSELKKNKACLFINDLYGTVQLWEFDRHAPWCKCND